MNSVSLIGRLTKKPEVRYIPASETAVATFSIAVNRVVGRGKEPATDFPRITVFGSQAENCEKYLDKGRLVGIQGRLQTGSYKNKDGVTVYTTDVIANNVEFLEWGDKKESAPREEAKDHVEESSLPSGFKSMEDDDDIAW